jgi:pimeloyl-ACP methyl ester carboxylesterase
VAFLILLSAPAVSPKVQLTSCRLNFMRAAGHGPDEIEEARSYLGLLWQCGRSDADWERYLAKRQVIDSKGWIPLLQGPAARDSEDLAWQELNLAYDPGPILKEVRCPVLCLFGAADRIVEPCVNAPLLAVAFAAAKNPDWTIQIVPGASHGLTLVDPQSPQRERPVEDESGFAPTVWETVRQWLRSHTSA